MEIVVKTFNAHFMDHKENEQDDYHVYSTHTFYVEKKLKNGIFEITKKNNIWIESESSKGKKKHKKITRKEIKYNLDFKGIISKIRQIISHKGKNWLRGSPLYIVINKEIVYNGKTLSYHNPNMEYIKYKLEEALNDFENIELIQNTKNNITKTFPQEIINMISNNIIKPVKERWGSEKLWITEEEFKKKIEAKIKAMSREELKEYFVKCELEKQNKNKKKK